MIRSIAAWGAARRVAVSLALARRLPGSRLLARARVVVRPEAAVLDDQVDRGPGGRHKRCRLVGLGAATPGIADPRELGLGVPPGVLRLADQAADLHLPGLEDGVG